MQKLQGFTYTTALDLNMSYYTIQLDPDGQKIYTIILPWGLVFAKTYLDCFETLSNLLPKLYAYVVPGIN
eukprot:10663836-Ditylum_brightwellii.AAC.1